MKKSKIFVTGGSGMVGKALLRQLNHNQDLEIFAPSHKDLDLRDQEKVFDCISRYQPDYVFHLAAIVGGIHANNTYPGKVLYDNTQMHCNVIHAAKQTGVKKLLFPGSACTYPKLAEQPIKETSFLDGKIEPTNIAYAAAKINGIVMCQSYAKEYGFNAIVPMPTNAYGVGDNFDPEASHVIPALMRRFSEAAEKITGSGAWGSGKVLREFIYVDDLADALIFLMQNYDNGELINVGTMQEISILELATLIAEVVGYEGKITPDVSKPDGAPRKCLDSSKLFALGWKPKISLRNGLEKMYRYHFAESVVEG